jgi:hypothetical protein
METDMDEPFPAMFEEYVLLLTAKRTMLRAEAASVTTLVAGSSHGDFGFDPAYLPGSFNLCCRSQDLKYSYFLYKTLSEQLEALRTIVVFYSVFSPGWVLDRSRSEGMISVAINELFNLGLDYEDPALTSLYETVVGKLGDLSVDVSGRSGFLPDYNKSFMPPRMTTEQRVADHMKFNRRENALPYLDMLISLSAQNRHRLLVVVPPVRSDFRIRAPGAELFRGLKQRTDGHAHVQVLDLYDHDDFEDGFFGDMDHLKPLGPGTALLSRLVDEALSRGS